MYEDAWQEISTEFSPVYEYGARMRDMYFPAGTGWYDYYRNFGTPQRPSEKERNSARSIKCEIP